MYGPQLTSPWLQDLLQPERRESYGSNMSEPMNAEGEWEASTGTSEAVELRIWTAGLIASSSRHRLDSYDDDALNPDAAQQNPSSGRKKKDLTRSRVIIACEGCRSRKARCDDEHPCGACARSKRECEYRHSQRRVWISQEWVARTAWDTSRTDPRQSRSSFLKLEKERDTLRRLSAALNEQVKTLGGVPTEDLSDIAVPPVLCRANSGAAGDPSPEGSVNRSSPPPGERQQMVRRPDTNFVPALDKADDVDQVASGIGKLMLDPAGTAREWQALP